MGAALIAYTLYRKRNIPELVAFYFCGVAFSYHLEGLALGLLRAYDYKPGVFADPDAENLLGHMLTNTSLWGGASLAVAALPLRFGWILALSGLFMLIETFFVKMGFYEQHWWRTYMTGVGSVIFFEVNKVWYAKMNRSRQGFMRYITFYHTALFVMAMPMILAPLFGKANFRIGWFDNLYRDNSIFALLYHAGLSSVSTLVLLVVGRWYWKLAAVTIWLLGDVAMVALGILRLHQGWTLFHTALINIVGWSLVVLLEHYAWRDVARKPPEWIPPRS